MQRGEVELAHRAAHPLAAQPVRQAIGIRDEQVPLVAGQDEPEGGLLVEATLVEGSGKRIRRDRHGRQQRIAVGDEVAQAIRIGVEQDPMGRRISSSDSSAFTSSIMIQSASSSPGGAPDQRGSERISAWYARAVSYRW